MRKSFALVLTVAIFGAGCTSDGKNGVDGKDGKDGTNGASCTVVVNTDSSATITCPDGTQYTVANGKDGASGTNGRDGADGASCSVTDNGNGTATITCPDGTSATVGTPFRDPVAWVETAHSGGIVLAGSSEVFSARYLVYNTGRVNPLRTLTVINDLEGAFDQPQDTLGIANVRVSCSPPSGSGATLTFSGSLVNGQVKFGNLNCYDESGTGLAVEVAFDAPFMVSVGESLSGVRVRLGIREDSLEVHGQDRINGFVIRKSKPTLAKVAGLSTTLVNGENRLYGLTVTADNAGAISFGRLTFQVDTDVPLANLRFYRGSTLLSPGAVNIFSETADLGSASGNPLTGNRVGVSFNQEETVAAGTSQSYALAATATGVLVGNAVVTRLLGDDNRLLQIASPAYNPLTGRIHTTDGSALFSNSAGLTQAKPLEEINIAWSDQSADAHAYPIVTNGLVAAGSGSCDWTNGWGLGVESLSSHTLTK
ncbi:hypothetical protein HZA44_01340 [Candidatus Peregrinibacteria bacterium]|nr:hypothetical protein [Candidatus Peregrinibacteria bacterium]